MTTEKPTTHTTATNWVLTYDPDQRTGTARWHKNPAEKTVTWQVLDGWLVTFRTVDAVPNAVISAAQKWITDEWS